MAKAPEKTKKAMIVMDRDYWPTDEEAAYLETKGITFPDVHNRRLTVDQCPEDGFPMELERAKAIQAAGKGHWPPNIIEVD